MTGNLIRATESFVLNLGVSGHTTKSYVSHHVAPSTDVRDFLVQRPPMEYK